MRKAKKETEAEETRVYFIVLKEIRIPHIYMAVFCSHHTKNVFKVGGELEDKQYRICTMAAFMLCMFHYCAYLSERPSQ